MLTSACLPGRFNYFGWLNIQTHLIIATVGQWFSDKENTQDTWLVSVRLLRASLLGGRMVEELKQRGVELIIRGPTTPSVEFAHILSGDNYPLAIIRFGSGDNCQVGSRWGLVSFSITILKWSNIICSYLVSFTNPLLKWSNIISSVVIYEAGQLLHHNSEMVKHYL